MMIMDILLLLFMISLCFVIVIILLFGYYYCYYYYYYFCLYGVRIPPGYRGWEWPFIGDTISFMRPHCSNSLGEFLDTHISKYGKIFRMNLLGKPTIISVDPEFNKFILMGEERGFENSCPRSIVEIMGRWSMLALVGDEHREMRNIAVSFMSKAKLKKYFLGDVERETLRILDSWIGRRKSFSAHDEGKKFAFNFMVKHLLGMDEGGLERENLRKEYATFMKGMASLPLNFPGTSYRKAIKSRGTILHIMGKKLEERIKRLHEKTELKEQEDDDLLTSVAKEKMLTRDQTLDLMLSLLFAGHETSSAAIALAIYFLESCPQAVVQLREEHMKIEERKKKKGEKGLDWIDYKQMTFTHCVINETLRLGNIVKFLHRRAIKDVEYNGYCIPNGWHVVPILSATHLDSSLFEEPHIFNPWRWQGNTNTNLMTFGGGPRICPGAELAKLEMAVFLHHLVLKFDWKLTEKDYPVSFPFLAFPKGLPIVVSPIG